LNPRNAWSLEMTPLVRVLVEIRAQARHSVGETAHVHGNERALFGPRQVFVATLHLAVFRWSKGDGLRFRLHRPDKAEGGTKPFRRGFGTHLSRERAMQDAAMMVKPPPTRDVHISILMPRSLVERIDDFHSEHRLPSRVEAIRQLIEAGLEAKRLRARP
jgi:hypothetical protein